MIIPLRWFKVQCHSLEDLLSLFLYKLLFPLLRKICTKMALETTLKSNKRFYLPVQCVVDLYLDKIEPFLSQVCLKLTFFTGRIFANAIKYSLAQFNLMMNAIYI